ncbi:MAG TPA: hypothetical protein VHK67_06725 [Rhabdochlamydiaceae bacterium]|jgi:hypothetical protein|nr:hypothetical protein [Rhabdochlamydiaceae bacterium]
MSHSFTTHEKSIRKQWLVVSVIAILAWPLIWLGFMSFISMKQPVPSEVFWICFMVTAITTAIFYALYRCTYVKPGIKFLTFALIVGPLLKLKATFDALKAGHDPVTLIALVLNLGFYVWWYVLSLQMRKMNKRIN